MADHPQGVDLLTAISANAGMFAAGNQLICASIVGALAEAGIVHPLRVAAWAKFFAENQGNTVNPNHREGVRLQLEMFAEALTVMTTAPADAGRA